MTRNQSETDQPAQQHSSGPPDSIPQPPGPGLEHQYRLEHELEKLLTPFQEFIRNQTTSSLLLIGATVLTLVIANSPLSSSYEHWLHFPLGLVAGDWQLSMSVNHWVNEGLMALFFFLLGMEMKREMLVGEINNMQFIIPVLAAAAGGMLIPALIFSTFNLGSDFSQGWGIPMATDTAFAIGILALLGRRIPRSAFAFLTALAIIDDMGAILIIALFYSDSLNLGILSLSGLVLLGLIAMNFFGLRHPAWYISAGLLLWALMLGSGIHATVAGILIAACVPARPKRASSWFMRRASHLLRRFEHLEQNKSPDANILADARQHAVVDGVKDAAQKASTPLRRWEHTLNQPVGLLVLPLFALANAGVYLNAEAFTQIWQHPLSLGIIGGLVLGKGLGIPLFTWLVIRLGWGVLGPGMTMHTITGLGLLGGIGFTMSIFISGLGFGNDPATLNIAKGAVLSASLVAGIGGYFWLRFWHSADQKSTEKT